MAVGVFFFFFICTFLIIKNVSFEGANTCQGPRRLQIDGRDEEEGDRGVGEGDIKSEWRWNMQMYKLGLNELA